MQEETKNENKNEVPAEIAPVEKVYATIDDFMKIVIKMGTVLSVEVVEKADKLYDAKNFSGLQVTYRSLVDSVVERRHACDLDIQAFLLVNGRRDCQKLLDIVIGLVDVAGHFDGHAGCVS